MKTQKRFFTTNMFKSYTIMGACVILVALFASAAQAETVMVDPGPASIPYPDADPPELNYAQDFIIDNQTDTPTVDVLFTDNKMLRWSSGDAGQQAIELYGPDSCSDVQIVLYRTDGTVAAASYGKFAPCDSAETIIRLSSVEEIGGIRINASAPGFTATGAYEWTWDDDQPVESRPQVWQLIGNEAPVADPGGPYTGNTGTPVQFDGSLSWDRDGSIADPGGYSWDFGDGDSATGSKAGHTYSEGGTYTVCLTVTDDDDVPATECTTAKIGLLADAGGPYVADGNGIVSFDSTGSLGTISDWDWDFGDGTTSTQANPGHTYDNTMGGEYDVILTLTDVSDQTDVDITTATVTAPESNQPPIPDAGEPVTGMVGEEITFDGSGSIDPDGEIVQYDWLFGESGGSGITDGGPNPIWVYDAPGTYTVTLKVFDDDSARVDDTTTAEIFEEGGVPPVADANGPYTGEVGVAVEFDSTGSYDPDGENLQYVWFFGDGNASFDPAPSHIYDAADAYAVDLYVIDDDGNIAQDNTSANIGFGDNQPPIANAGGPYSGVVNAPVSFDGTGSYDPDGEIKSFEWDFGDGNSSFAPEPQHTYLQPGPKVVILKVTDDGGAYDQETIKVTIGDGNLAPVADPGGPYLGQVDVPKTFDGSGSYDPDGGTITTYQWDFGDGSDAVTSPDPTATHVYEEIGYFTAVLYVTDDDGLTGAQQTSVGIGETSAPPVADAGGPYIGTPGAAINFDGSGSKDLEGPIATWEWNFGDGNTGEGEKTSHTYDETGTYILRLTVTDGSGETDRDVTKVTVAEGDLPPVADAGGPYPGAPDEVVSFDGTGSYDRNGGTLTYAWDFGDDTTGSGATPSHTYSKGGPYRVTLTVTNSVDRKDSDTTLAVVLTLGKATLISPSGTITDNTPTYTWNALAESTWYRLFVWDSTKTEIIDQWYTADEAGCSDGTGECSVTPETVLADDSHEWWIRTWNDNGDGPWSDKLSFTVDTSVPPGKATLISPSGTITVNSPTYTWNAVANATWYQLQVNDSDQEQKILQWYTADEANCGDGTGECSVTPTTELADGAAKWWIQTWNEFGTGPWSARMSITVDTSGE